MKLNKLKILLTSVGRRGYIIKYFREIEGVEIHACNSHFTGSLKEADYHFISPLVHDKSYIDTLTSYCFENKISAVMSLFDIDLIALGLNTHRFEKIKTRVLHAPHSSLEICNDKWKTAQFAKKYGFNSPKTYISLDKVKRDLNLNSLTFPLVIKPRWGMGSIGLYKINDLDELSVLYKKCEHQVFSSYLKYESSQTKEQSIIIQKFLNKKEYGLDIFNNLNGQFVTVVAKQKVQMRSGETDIGLTVNSDKFMEFSKKLASLTNHIGILSADVFVDENDEIFLLEMNCRISGHYPVSHCAGVNFPSQLVRWLKGEPTDMGLFNYEKNIYVEKQIIPIILPEL